jgi:hypothetical protein
MPLFFFNVKFLKSLIQGGNNWKIFFKILNFKLPEYYNIHILNIEWFLGKNVIANWLCKITNMYHKLNHGCNWFSLIFLHMSLNENSLTTTNNKPFTLLHKIIIQNIRRLIHLEQQKKDHTLANKTSNQPTIQNEQGKTMVTCLVFDILKSPHFKSTKILVVIVMIKL